MGGTDGDGPAARRPRTPRRAPSPSDAVDETSFLASVRELAHGLRWLTYHTHNSRRSEPGFPDLVLVRGDRVVYRELKTNAGRVTAAQQVWLDALVAGGADAAVWRPVDLEAGEIQRDLLRGTVDRSFAATLEVRMAQARARRALPRMRDRGMRLAPRTEP